MQGNVFKILLVDDDEDDYILTKDLLSEIGERAYDLEWVTSYEAGLEAINGNSHDACLLDFHLGERTGLELLRQVVTEGCRIPIIMLTGKGTKGVDIEVMQAGASDYLDKREVNAQLLERSIRYAIERKRSEEHILHMAFYDSLTNLPNRALFHDRLKQTLAHARRYHVKAAIMFLDLDNFKRINDTLEHRVGDLLLQGVAERLSHFIRSSDTVAREANVPIDNTVARLGGDEFTILLTEIQSAQDAVKVAQRILNTIAEPFRLDEHEVFVTASIGIAIYPFDGQDMDTLLKNADIAMYHAKEHGKNNFQFYKTAMNATALERLSMESNLRRAIEREEFLLHYQPRMDMRSGKIVGTEALLRWNHPQRGLVYPSDFIGLAEETGVIIPIGEWVLRKACEQNKLWQNSGSVSIPVSVSMNLSGQQFGQDSLIKIVAKVLSDCSLDPGCLELEITESVIMKNVETTMTILKRLKEMGVQLSMDDFGTGYSSFTYLKRFPLDNIKIDRSFMKDVTRKREDASIVRAIIAMAHSLRLKVIAEGVETEEQMAFLRDEGCDEMQGYLLSTPLPPQDILSFLGSEKNKTLV